MVTAVKPKPETITYYNLDDVRDYVCEKYNISDDKEDELLDLLSDYGCDSFLVTITSAQIDDRFRTQGFQIEVYNQAAVNILEYIVDEFGEVYNDKGDKKIHLHLDQYHLY